MGSGGIFRREYFYSMNDKKQKLNTEELEIQNPNIRKRRRKEADYYRVSINKQAADSLDSMMARANDGFEGGQISRSDLANRIFIETSKTFSDVDIKILRSLHFDERRMLQALLTDSAEAKDLPDEIKGAIRKHYGISDSERRRSTRAMKDDSSGIIPAA